ncbi:MAG TPA: hypothetical protein VNM69_06970 [Bacillus sp. (in: firmicutes)]|uniref:hypothetical protein n=1 Tax=Bacillus litorisediminis TaxID=2922713 RepID=UPI001FAD55CD|nr:hypothetical protein [Bacillus litorisediminis]HWO75650.1 hypothetical protein [Bacillus sp. (in: firmicutes)]
MRNVFIGFVFSVLLLLCFTLLNRIGISISFGISLVISSIVFVYYVNNKKPNLKGIVLISIVTGVFYIIFVSIGVKLFPNEEVRDLGDVVMPYLYAFIFGLLTTFVFIFLGFKYAKSS